MKPKKEIFDTTDIGYAILIMYTDGTHEIQGKDLFFYDTMRYNNESVNNRLGGKATQNLNYGNTK